MSKNSSSILFQFHFLALVTTGIMIFSNIFIVTFI